MSQYFLSDITLRKGYVEKNPALARLLKSLFPSCDESTIWDKPYSVDEVNDEIDKLLKDVLHQNTAGLCLDYFAELFGDGTIDTSQVMIMPAIREIVRHKEIIRKNIREKCAE